MDEKREGVEMSAGEIQGIRATTGFERPVLDKRTPAKVIDVRIMKKEPKVDEETGKEFIPAYMQMSLQIEGFEPVIYESVGFRFYKLPGGEIQYFAAPSGSFGRLKTLMMETFGFDNKVELARIVSSLKGKEVMVKTEPVTFKGEKFNKIVIQQFRV